jgi:hypothetical protein
MPRDTTLVEALIIDYLHRAGEGVGEKQAVIDYMTTVVGYSEMYIAHTLHGLARDGLLDRYGGEGSSASTYSINYNSWDDGL